MARILLLATDCSRASISLLGLLQHYLNDCHQGFHHVATSELGTISQVGHALFVGRVINRQEL